MDEAQYTPRSGFFAALPSALQKTLLGESVVRLYADAAIIHRRGDHDQGLSVVRSGAARVANVGRDGRVVTLVTLQPGESFGELTAFARLPRQYDITARGTTVINYIDRRRLDALLLSSPDLNQHVIRHLAERLQTALGLLDDERRLPLVVRLARRLVEWSAYAADVKQVNATQQEIADELAVSRVALSTAIHCLVDEGLISTGYGYLTVRDRVRLESWVQAELQLSSTAGPGLGGF